MKIPLNIAQSELERVCRTYHIRSLRVFGSALHGDAGPESDLDLLVEFEPGYIPGFLFSQIQDELSQLAGRPVDLHTRGSLSEYFRETVVREAQPLYVHP